jgi:sterol desaturase/sphingolipid hydroxylase (fatty acid hydroxylase superfamily)
VRFLAGRCPVSVRGWRQFTPFYFYTAAALCLCVAAAGGGPSRGVAFSLLVSGLLSWGLVEYALHRFIFHHDARSERGRKFVYAAHLSHHEDPGATERLFTGLRMSVPIAAGYWLLAWAATGSWRAAVYLFVGLVAGYFCYEWLHFQAHHGSPRLRPLRYLRKYHLLHHHRDVGGRFGVTSPLFDLAFGTFRPAGTRRPRGSSSRP